MAKGSVWLKNVFFFVWSFLGVLKGLFGRLLRQFLVKGPPQKTCGCSLQGWNPLWTHVVFIMRQQTSSKAFSQNHPHVMGTQVGFGMLVHSGVNACILQEPTGYIR